MWYRKFIAYIYISLNIVSSVEQFGELHCKVFLYKSYKKLYKTFLIQKFVFIIYKSTKNTIKQNLNRLFNLNNI